MRAPDRSREIGLLVALDRWTWSTATVLREIALHAEGHEFSAWSRPVTEEDREQGAELWKRPGLRKVSPPAHVLKRGGILHVHAPTPAATAVTVLSRGLHRRRRPRVVFTVATPPREDAPFAKRYAAILVRADRVVAISRFLADRIRDFGYDRRVEVIPNGVDKSYFDPARVAGNEEGGGHLLFVGTLVKAKRPDLLLSLARRLPREKFVVAGEVVDEEGAALAARLGRESNIDYLGVCSRDRIRRLMAAAKALVFPSEREGFGLVMVEALAMGVPVVAQPVCAAPEVVRPGENGYLAAAADLGGWAEAIAEIDRRRRGGAGVEWSRGIREDCIRRFSWERIGQLYGELYNEELAREGEAG